MLRTTALALALLLAAAPAVARANDREVSVRGSDSARPLHATRHHVPAETRTVRRRVAHAPVHAHRGHRCRYVAGHTVVKVRDVTVPGHYVTTERPARHTVRWSAHRRAYVKVLVRPRRIVKTWVPPHTERRRSRLWVPGRWRCRGY